MPYHHVSEGAITGFEDIVMSFEPEKLSMLVNRQQRISDMSHHAILEAEKCVDRELGHGPVSGLRLNLKKNFHLWQTKFPDVANDFFDFQIHQVRHILHNKLMTAAKEKILDIKEEVAKPCDEQEESEKDAGMKWDLGHRHDDVASNEPAWSPPTKKLDVKKAQLAWARDHTVYKSLQKKSRKR